MIGAPLHEFLSGVSQVATSALAAAIWQGILLTGAAALGLRLLPSTPPAVRFSIWFAVFVLVAALPFATLGMVHPGTASSTASSHAWFTIDERWCVGIAALWACASLTRAVTLVAAGFRVRALWKRARPVDAAVVDAPSLARKAQVCTSDEVDRPTVIGFFAPKIVIPEWLIAKLTPEEMEQVILHEAGHLTRKDDWLNLLQKFALVVFPLNPALAWVERRLCFERELACDERVLRATGAPKAYAECLATLAEYRLERRGFVRQVALALGALGRESELGQRVLRIVGSGSRRGMKRSHARFVLGGATLSLVFAATALEHSPQLVGFSHAEPAAAREGHTMQQASNGFHAIAVRASVAPAAQWKSIGDATPRIAKTELRPTARKPRPVQQLQQRAPLDPAPQAVATTRYEAPHVPRMIQTVATTRQVMADGDLVVTRLVTVRAYNVSSPDASRSISDSPERESQSTLQQQEKLRRYAAVPVQGGWLVFQL